jgi:hypothetical protein
MFGHLEEAGDTLGVLTFGISVTSLEEVFLKLAEVVEEAEAVAAGGGAGSGVGGDKGGHAGKASSVAVFPPLAVRATSVDSASNAARVTSSSYMEVDVEHGAGLAVDPLAPSSLNTILQSLGVLSASSVSFLAQARTQVWRRVLQAKRDRRGLFLQCVFPLVFVSISFVFRSMNNINAATTLTTFAMSASQLVAPGVAHLALPYLVNGTGTDAWSVPITGAMGAFAVPGSNGSALALTPIAPYCSWRGVEQRLYDGSYAAGALVFSGDVGAPSPVALTVMVRGRCNHQLPLCLCVSVCAPECVW